MRRAFSWSDYSTGTRITSPSLGDSGRNETPGIAATHLGSSAAPTCRAMGVALPCPLRRGLRRLFGDRALAAALGPPWAARTSSCPQSRGVARSARFGLARAQLGDDHCARRQRRGCRRGGRVGGAARGANHRDDRAAPGRLLRLGRLLSLGSQAAHADLAFARPQRLPHCAALT